MTSSQSCFSLKTLRSFNRQKYINFRHNKVGIVNKLLFCFISILKFLEKHSFTGVIIDGRNNFLVAFFIFRFTRTHQNKNMRERFCLVYRINSTCRKVPLKGDRSQIQNVQKILVNSSQTFILKKAYKFIAILML